MPRELSAPASPAKPALGPTRSSLGGTAVHWNNATLEQRRFGLRRGEVSSSATTVVADHGPCTWNQSVANSDAATKLPTLAEVIDKELLQTQVSATISEAEDDVFDSSDSSSDEDELEESESDESELEDEDTDNNVVGSRYANREEQ